jgi:hypothetical protein
MIKYAILYKVDQCLYDLNSFLNLVKIRDVKIIMNLHEIQLSFIKDKIISLVPDADIYLFDLVNIKGEKTGDGEITIISEKELAIQELMELRTIFCKLFGFFSLDISSYNRGYKSDFLDYIKAEGIKL